MFAPKLDGSTATTTIWDELPDVIVDTTRLEYLFENRAKDFLSKVGQNRKCVITKNHINRIEEEIQFDDDDDFDTFF